MIYLLVLAVGVYAIIWSWLLRQSKKISPVRIRLNSSIPLPTFTVIIPVHNEESVLETLCQSLKRQQVNWEKGKIIFALNQCTDKSENLVKVFCSQFTFAEYFHLKKIPDDWSPKKYALFEALQRATGEVILQTDADAKLPENWIITHLKAHATHPELHVLFGLYRFEKNDSIFGKWLKTDRLWTFLISLVFNAVQKPILGFGINLSYKNRREDHQGILREQRSVLSGDDDLLIQRLIEKGLKAGFIGEVSSWPETRLPGNWRQLWLQRRRHVKAGFNYPPEARLFYALLIGAWTIIVAGIFWTYWAIPAIVLKCLADFILLKKVSLRCDLTVSLWEAFLYEWLYVPYIWVTGLASIFLKARWK